MRLGFEPWAAGWQTHSAPLSNDVRFAMLVQARDKHFAPSPWSWVRFPALYTGWTFFTFICCKNCKVCLERPKINEKEAGVGPFFKKNTLRLTKVK